MAGTNFLGSLLEFKKDIINEETIELMDPYIRMEDYDHPTAVRVCGNVAGLLSWTVAMTNFYAINKEVLPLKVTWAFFLVKYFKSEIKICLCFDLKDNLAVQEVRLNAAMLDLNKAQAQLDEKEKELGAAMAEYNSAMSEKQRLMDDADNCRRKMNAASALIEGLADEKERWTEQSKEFKAQIGR